MSQRSYGEDTGWYPEERFGDEQRFERRRRGARQEQGFGSEASRGRSRVEDEGGWFSSGQRYEGGSSRGDDDFSPWGTDEGSWEYERARAGGHPYGGSSYGAGSFERGSPGSVRGSSGFGREGEYRGRGSMPRSSHGSGVGATWPGEPVPSGRFSGIGPKGYQRSRERILDDVCERLAAHPEIDASGIEVDVSDDVVVLRGAVHDRSQKRMAEDAVENVSGIRDVRNELDVEKGMLQTLTDAITGKADEEGLDTDAAPRKARTSATSKAR